MAQFGWRSTLAAAAAAGLAIAVLLWLVVRDKPRGAMPIGGALSLLGGLKRVVRNRQTWACAILGGAMTAPTLSFAGLWGVPFLVQVYGIPKGEAAFAASLGFIGFGCGAILLGFLSDRIGRRKPLLVTGAGLLLLSLLGMFYIENIPIGLFMALNFLHGIGGGCMVVGFATAREHNPVNATGAAYGFVNTFVVASGAIFQPLIGWLLDLNWDQQMLAGARIYSAEAYRIALTSLPVMATIGLLAALGIRETHCQQQVH